MAQDLAADTTGQMLLLGRGAAFLTAFLLVAAPISILLALCGGDPKKSRGRYTRAASLTLALALSLALVLNVLPTVIERSLNKLSPDYEYEVLSEARQLHSSLFVVDLHADSLLWQRDLNQRADHGHVDVPRLIEGNVALQAFTIVTSVPSGLNFVRNEKPSHLLKDQITLMGVAQMWGLDSVHSLAARTLYQTEKLKKFASESNGKLSFISTRADLEKYSAKRSSGSRDVTAGFLGIEGLHALDGQVDNVDKFREAGVRMMGLTHFFDNEIGGSAHGVQQGGISRFGEEVLERIRTVGGIVVDVAHASAALIDDVCKHSGELTIMTSHTGVRGICDNQRNLKDDHLRCIARSKGVVGIAFFRPSICGDDQLQSIVDSIKYVRDLVGVEHVALGSDWDGSVTTPIDASQMDVITDALRREGSFSDEDISLVMGENVRQMLLHSLPQ